MRNIKKDIQSKLGAVLNIALQWLYKEFNKAFTYENMFVILSYHCFIILFLNKTKHIKLRNKYTLNCS